MVIQGQWHSEGSAARTGAALTCFEVLYTLNTDSGESFTGQLSDLKVSDRLGNIERTITLANGSVFCTNDNDAVDDLFKNSLSANGIISRLESHLGWVAGALVVTVIFSFGLIKWGIPWTGKAIAHALPHEVNEYIAEGSMDFLDEYIFDESKLDSETREQITRHFNEVLLPLADADTEVIYKIHFREWTIDDTSVPNAFALPSGDIILTDKFVELTETQDEIDAILLHEMGHVVHRHSLEMITESTIFGTLLLLVTGDNSVVVDMGIGIGSLLVSSHYSRGHESEADMFAFEQMLAGGIDPRSFSSIMARMTEYMSQELENETEGAEETAQADAQPSANDNIEDNENPEDASSRFMDYLSSHPNTEDRIKIADRFSECFQNGQTTCQLNP